jgi:hypothetical protein
MLDFFFLDNEQIFINNKSSIFRKNPEIIIAPVTDYSILLGLDLVERNIGLL